MGTGCCLRPVISTEHYEISVRGGAKMAICTSESPEVCLGIAQVQV